MSARQNDTGDATIASMTTKVTNKRVVIEGLSDQEALAAMDRLSQFILPEGATIALEDEPEATGGGSPIEPDPG